MYAAGDQLAIVKQTGRRLGMGTNMYPSSALLGQNKDEIIASVPVDDLIEKADGFAGVFPGEHARPALQCDLILHGYCIFLVCIAYGNLKLLSCDAEHKYDIVKKLQEMRHICGVTGDGVNDAPALKKADIRIAVADATDAARSASDIVLTEPGLSVIISAMLTSRAIFQRMKNYAVSLPDKTHHGYTFFFNYNSNCSLYYCYCLDLRGFDKKSYCGKLHSSEA